MRTIRNREQAARVKALAAIVLNIGQSFNQTLTQTKQVRPVFMAHYINLKNGKMGIEDCIAETLEELGATKPSKAMLARDITEAVNVKFRKNSTRYPESTISQYLCNSQGLFCKKHVFGKVNTGSNPRLAYYLDKAAE